MNKNTVLLKTIEEIQLQLDCEVIYLNSGGCGIFAITMYAYMIKYGFNCKIVFYSTRDRKKYDEVFSEIQNKNHKNQSLLSASHIAIKYKNKIFDGFRFYQKKDFTITGEFSIKELALSLKYGNWNSAFNRKKYSKIVRDIIKNEFKRSFPVTK